MGPSIERISGAWAAQATYLTVLQASLKVTRRDATIQRIYYPRVHPRAHYTMQMLHSDRNIPGRVQERAAGHGIEREGFLSIWDTSHTPAAYMRPQAVCGVRRGACVSVRGTALLCVHHCRGPLPNGMRVVFQSLTCVLHANGMHKHKSWELYVVLRKCNSMKDKLNRY